MTETATTPGKRLFETDNKAAVDAIGHAQWIAFAPYVFQASVTLRDTGILKMLEDSRSNGLTIQEVADKINYSVYAVRVLLEAGLGIGLVYRKEDRFLLAKTGHFFINHPLTRINTDFMKDVCYDGAKDLNASLQQGKPVGLQHFGSWETIYQGLGDMAEPARTSWFNFDHFYSDNAFPHAMPIIFERKPKKILDIGANSGKFSLACLNHDQDVHVGLVDLKVQLDVARQVVADAGLTNRVTFHDLDILKEELPTGYDIMWMSQFLDCFSEDRIISILEKCKSALNDDGSIFLAETFWDRQRFEAFAFSLQMISLYFTTMANGYSQMYNSELFTKLIDQAGFKIVAKHDGIGLGHTIFEIKKK
jgi:2-polyprenyl-3-methyl-5-hydroxy-6-metoxy-1,4-benzoquinol methylase